MPISIMHRLDQEMSDEQWHAVFTQHHDAVLRALWPHAGTTTGPSRLATRSAI